MTDVYAALPSMTGKFELEYEGEMKGADQVARDLIRGSVSRVCEGCFTNGNLKAVARWLDQGGSLSLTDSTAAGCHPIRSSSPRRLPKCQPAPGPAS